MGFWSSIWTYFGYHYLKLKEREGTLCIIYPLNGVFHKRVISIHPDNTFTKRIIVNENYYKSYNAPYYNFDGDYDNFVKSINGDLSSFKKKTLDRI